VAEKRVSGVGPRSGQVGRLGAPVPVGVTPILRRFWDFARNMARRFSSQLLDPEEHEEEFLKVVRRDFEKWE